MVYRLHEVPLTKAYQICLHYYFARNFLYVDGLPYIFTTNTPKFQCFNQQIEKYGGVKCTKCSLQANVCFIETSFAEHPLKNKKISVKTYNKITNRNCNLNFYHKTENQKLILMTLDHMIPVSQGGPYTAFF